MRACSNHSTFILKNFAHGVINNFSPNDNIYTVSIPHFFFARPSIIPAFTNKNGDNKVNKISHPLLTGGLAKFAHFATNFRSLNYSSSTGQLPKKNASCPRSSSSSISRKV